MVMLELNGVTKQFAGVRATDGVTLDVPEGCIFGLIGPNGAGKTTLVNLVTGYLTPDAGDIAVRGQSVLGMPPHRLSEAGVARTYQNLQLFEESTVLENVLIGRHKKFSTNPVDAFFTHRSAKIQHREAMALLDRVALADHADAYVEDLPYGMRRRVEIARALATEPALLLLDEPTAGMTKAEAFEIAALIRSVNAEGVTVLLVEHNVALVTATCDEIAVMDWGAVIARGEPKEVWVDENVRTAYLGRRRTV